MRCTVGVTSRSRSSAGTVARPSTSWVTAPVVASTLRIEPGSTGVIAVSTKRDPSSAQRTDNGTTGPRSTSTRWRPSASWIARTSRPSTWWLTSRHEPSREAAAPRSCSSSSTRIRQVPSRSTCQTAWWSRSWSEATSTPSSSAAQPTTWWLACSSGLVSAPEPSGPASETTVPLGWRLSAVTATDDSSWETEVCTTYPPSSKTTVSSPESRSRTTMSMSTSLRRLVE